MLAIIIISTVILAIVYFVNRELTTNEFLLTVLAVVLSTMIVYGFSLIPFPNDSYFASGRLTATIHYPEWVEEYQQAHTRCSGSGKNESCTTYYTTEHRTHSEYWSVQDSLDREWEVSYQLHKQIRTEFGNNKRISQPPKGGFDYGDPNVYSWFNDTNSYKYVTTQQRNWFNPIKGTHSLFNEGSGDFKLDYPKAVNDYLTNRLMTSNGTDVTKHDVDVLNTQLFASKGVNLNVTQLNNSSDCDNLEAYWNGGAKNDIDICVVGKYNNPDYVKVFGWMDDPILKKDIETIILDEGFVKKCIPEIQQKIITEYKPIDWKQYRYIKRDCPLHITIIAIIVAIIVSCICVFNFSENYDRRD